MPRPPAARRCTPEPRRVESVPWLRDNPRPLGCGRSSGVEHNLAKVRVARSIRVARSSWFLTLEVVPATVARSAVAGLGSPTVILRRGLALAATCLPRRKSQRIFELLDHVE